MILAKLYFDKMARNHDIAELEQRSFREMLISVSQRLTRSELDTLKFYCADFIPLARREDIETVVQLWEAIIENGRMSSSDTAFLQELMEKAIQRPDLLDIVIQYSNSIRVSLRIEKQTGLIREFEFVAENINLRKWRHLVRTLGVTDADIDLLAEQYRTNVREQVLRALLLWASRSGTQVSRTALKDALINCQLRSLADTLESLGELH